MKERTKFLIILGAFLLFYFLPFEHSRVQNALLEGFLMLQDYARRHVLLCLVPAFFIAGAIQNFVSKEAVLKYFGPKGNKVLAYSIAAVSGAILAVCSCTVLPMFMGIYYAGAGLGVATTFLYSVRNYAGIQTRSATAGAGRTHRQITTTDSCPEPEKTQDSGQDGAVFMFFHLLAGDEFF